MLLCTTTETTTTMKINTRRIFTSHRPTHNDKPGDNFV